MIFLIILLLIIVICFGVFLYLKIKLKRFTKKYFSTTDLKKAIEKSNFLDSETPKSLSSMESISLNQINKDFPDLNVNEIKQMAEKALIQCFDAIERKKLKESIFNCEKINTWIDSKINDLGNTTIEFSDFKFHNTVINRYEKNNGVATLYLETALEYYCKKNNEIKKKIQDRYKLEYIYIIDISKVSINKKALGLNCPNCGAPVKTVGDKYCLYCGSGISDIVKKTWNLNNIKQY